ncbi:regulator of telomere elongation helicase 1-like 1 [Frankliniella occidentalis]|nr:regulator of telomere elongation helicase 1-like 1 [Frankliniella occidentalis]
MTMEKFKIHDIWVHFPFVPYPSQEAFMAKLLESLNGGKNGLLESPTGTGKTLCLLCASMAWLDLEKRYKEIPDLRLMNESGPSAENETTGDEMPVSGQSDFKPPKSHKIYFCSRTHSQIMQAIQEFKNTGYQHLRTTVLASRNHLCIHPSAKKAGGNLDNKCRSLRKKTKCDAPDPLVIPDIEDVPKKCQKCNCDHTCPFYTNFQEMKKAKGDELDFPFTFSGAFDQKTLIEKCKKYSVCPFYMSRHLKETADVIFLPYSYIFNPHILKGLNLDIMNAIIIIDEGHNLEKVCEENASFSIQFSDVDNCSKELKNAKYTGDEKFPASVRERDLHELQEILVKLRKNLELLEADKARNGQFCISIFSDSGFTKKEWRRQLHNLKEVAQFFGEKELKTEGMRKITNVVTTVFYLDSDDGDGSQESTLEKSFVLYKEKLTPETILTGVEPKIFLWCFDAGVIMKSLQRKGVHSFIVTSGTLSPLEPLKSSLGITFEVELINEHVIDTSQVLALSIGRVEKASLDARFNYRERNKDILYPAFGQLVLKVAEVSPKGLLIFFPSGKVKKDCLDNWNNTPFQDSSLYDAIEKQKVIYEEPKNSSDLPGLQKVFFKKIAEPNSKGACLVGVLSGKVSEGIDFKDDLGRAVIMFGIPFPPFMDPWVKHKRKHICEHRGEEADEDWYLSQGIRPVNQALGRIIRHQGDYGVVVLADTRYIIDQRIIKELPGWLKKAREVVAFPQVSYRLKNFFSTIPSKMKNIKKRTEIQQEKIRERHQKEMEIEEHPAYDYHDLSNLKMVETKRKQILSKEILDLEKKIQSASALTQSLLVEIAETKVKIGIREVCTTAADNCTDYDSDCESTGDGEWDEAIGPKCKMVN